MNATSLKNLGHIEAVTMSELLDLMELTISETVIRDKAIAWISSVFETIHRLKTEQDFEPQPPPSIQLSRETRVLVLIKALAVLSFGFDISDISLYYLNDLGKALKEDTKTIRKILELKMKRMREDFTTLAKTRLDQKQRNWCALIILKMIFADGSVHPSEKVYFSVIEKLIENSGKTISDLKQAALSIEQIPHLQIDQEITFLLLKHIVTIAMFDGEYVGQEAEFIKQAAAALNIQEERVESIIQPVASAYMVIQTLFP